MTRKQRTAFREEVISRLVNEYGISEDYARKFADPLDSFLIADQEYADHVGVYNMAEEIFRSITFEEDKQRGVCSKTNL